MDKVVISAFTSFFKGGHKMCCGAAILICYLICENKLCLYTDPGKSSTATGNILSTMIAGETINFNNIITVFVGLGIVVAFIGLAASFILIANSGLIEVKDSYVTMFFRFILAIGLALSLNAITLKGLEFGTRVETSMNSVLAVTDSKGNKLYGIDSLMGQGLIYNMMSNGQDEDGNPDLGWLGMAIDNTKNSQKFTGDSSLGKFFSTWMGVSYSLFAALINFVLAFIISWNLIKLAVELIKRFVMTQVLQMVSPMFGGFFASSSSMNVFLSYVKMFTTEIGIYLVTKLWFAMSIMLLSSKEASSSLASIIMIYAFVIIGVQMERMARDLGLTTSSQGAALLDNMIMNGTMMGMALGGMKTKLGNGIFGLGALSGNSKVAAIGGMLSGRRMDYSPAGLQKAIQGSMQGQFRKNATANSAASNLTNSMKKGAFDALKTGGFEGKNALNSLMGDLNNSGRKELLGSLANEFYKLPNGQSLAQGYGMNRLNLTGFDNGIAIGNLKNASGQDLASFSIGSVRPQNGPYQTITDINGQEKFLSFSPIQDQGELAGRSFDNSSANNLLSPGRALTDGEIATGCLLDSDTKLYHGADGTVDLLGSNYQTTALGDNAYAILHSDPISGQEQVAAVDFGNGKCAEHGYRWNNLSDVNTRNDIKSYFNNNLGEIDRMANRINSVVPTGNNRFTVSYNANINGQSIPMKKDFIRATSAATAKVGDYDSLTRIKSQRLYGTSSTGHWLGSKSTRVKSEQK